jgi:uncharacterized protein involved in outer membrane biogenesis
VETFGPQLTKVDVKLDAVKVSLLSGGGSVKGLVVGNPTGYKTPNAISVGSASLAISPGSLLSDKVVIKKIEVLAPEITIEGGLTDNNLKQIMDNLTASTAGGGEKKGTTPAKPGGPGKKLQVDDFLIKDAKLHMSLGVTGGKTLTMPLADIHLTNLGQGPEGITAGDLSKRVMGEILSSAGKVVSSDAVGNLTKGALDAAKGAGKTAGDTLNKATKSITDIFKK